MNNNEKLNILDEIENISLNLDFVCSALTTISNALYYCDENYNKDHAQTIELVKLTVESSKKKLMKVWDLIPSNSKW